MGNVLTLRNVPSEVVAAIKERSRTRGLSINKAAISLLEEWLGKQYGQSAPEVYHDLDHLAGRWSTAEAEVVERALSEMRSVDQELWR